MPVAGSPVASITTSISGWLITAMASSVTKVLPLFSASAIDLASVCSFGQLTSIMRSRARCGIRSARPIEVHARGQPHLRQEHGAELAGADLTDADRPAGRRALAKHGREIHVISSRVSDPPG